MTAAPEWLNLVELYEYKVADLIDGREPRGGRRSVRDLRKTLSGAPIVGQTLKRFREADRSWREKLRPADERAPTRLDEATLAQSLSLDLGPGTEAAGIADEPAAELDDEGRALRALAEAAWRSGFEDELREQAPRLRAEASRPTLRLVYAALHNLDQYAQTSTFATDANLARFRVISRVPAADDPLAPLSSASVAEELLADLAARLLDLRGHHPNVPVAETEALAYLRRFFMAVVEDPTAGEPGVQPSGPGAREIQGAIEEARRENLPHEAKRQLLERLGKQFEVAQARERAGANAVAQERKTLKTAAESLFGWLGERLPARLGGRGQEPTAARRAVGALEHARRADGPEDGSTELAVRLSRPGHATVGGVPVSWNDGPDGWALEVGGAEYRLDTGLRVPWEGRELRAYRHEGYALLTVQHHDGEGLWGLLALTACTALLLDPAEDYQNLRMARAATALLRDRHIDAAQHGPDTAERFASAADDALLSFARGGAEKLLERFRRVIEPGAVDRAFASVAGALNETGASTRAASLTRAFRAALEPRAREPREDHEVRSPEDVVLVAYRGEPVTVRVAGRPFTVRADGHGKVFAIPTGGAPRVLGEVLPFPIPGGFALLAREGLRVAVGFTPGS